MKYEKAVDCLSRRISGFSEKLGPGVAMWEVDENWLPALRNMCLNSELQGKTVTLAVPAGDQLSLAISRKRMSVLAMVPFNVVTAMSTTCSDLGGS